MEVLVISQSFPTLCDPWAVAQQAPLSMEFSRQEYWNGLPFPTQGNLPDPRIEPMSPALAPEFSTTVPPEIYYVSLKGKDLKDYVYIKKKNHREFLGSPVIRIWHFDYQGRI